MSATEWQEPGGTDPIDLQLPRGATGSGREQSTPQSTAPVTRFIDTKSFLLVTPYHGGKASFLGWKWSFLIAVRAISNPLYEGLKKNWRQHESGFPKIPIVHWRSGAFRSGVHTVSIASQRWSVCLSEIRWGRKRPSSMASPLESTNRSECDKHLESVTGTNIHVTRPMNQSSTMEQICWGVRDTNQWTSKWWYPKGSLHE